MTKSALLLTVFLSICTDAIAKSRGVRRIGRTRKLQKSAMMGMGNRMGHDEDEATSGEEELAAMMEPFSSGDTAPTMNADTMEEDAVELEKVNISIQPAYHGIPVYLGVELGLYEAVGLEVDISVWSSGGPQVTAAAEEDAWDFGVAGSVPNIVAATKGISTVGLSNQESAANQVVGAPGVTDFPPTEFGPSSFAVSAGSTGDLVMRRCLEAFGVEFDETNFLGGSPAEVTEALESGTSDYGALWAPNSYVYLTNNADAKEFCNGEAVGVTVLGGLMVRDEWAEENPMLAAKAVAVYLLGVTLMQNLDIREKILEYSRGFYDFVEKSPSDEDIERDFLTRPTFNLDAQLGMMSRNFVNGGVSNLDTIYTDLAMFLQEQGTIEEIPEPESYLSDAYLQMISSDPDLRSYAYEGYHLTAADLEDMKRRK